MLFRRGTFFVLWILVFGLFYWFHYLEKHNDERQSYVGITDMVVYFCLWAWVAMYRKIEPKLAKVSQVFLFLFLLMVGVDGPITE